MSFNPDPLYQLVGRRVRNARNGKMSQAKLAQELGLSRASVVNIEAGRQRTPLHVLWRIAEKLQTDVALLIPDQAEFSSAYTPASLTSEELAKIEEAAAGDPDTRRHLEHALERIGRAK